jgi:hypothetical protein
MANYTSVLTMLLRLRQGELQVERAYTACDHPLLVTSSFAQVAVDDDADDDLAELLGGLKVNEGADSE